MVTGKDYEGYTTLGSDGVRHIDLNTDGKSALDLSVLLAHEAFRDGVVSDANSQQLETQKAAFYHMQVSAAINGQYGGNYLNDGNRDEAEMYMDAVESGDYSKVMNQMGKYESSGDFWKLMDDGSIEWDGQKSLYDEDGNLVRVATGTDGNHLGYSESLLAYMGDANAEKFLSDKGVDTSGMSRAELAYALMKSSGVEWTGSEYTPSKLPGGWQYSSLEDRLSFNASDDVLDQVAMRDSIIEGLEAYQNAANLGLASTELGSMYSELIQRMGDYNNLYALQGIGVAPEGRISQGFGNKLDREEVLKDNKTQYLSYTHPAIDVVGSEGIYSPGFSVPGKDKLDYAFGLNLIGTNANYLYEHMNPSGVSGMSMGEFLMPGQRIMDFPDQRYPTDGGGSGTHGHFEVSLYDADNGWGFGNPTNYMSDHNWYSPQQFSGKYETQFINRYGKKQWTTGRIWEKWEPWYDQY